MKTVYREYLTERFIDLDRVSQKQVCEAQDIVRGKIGVIIGDYTILDCYLCVVCGNNPSTTFITIRNKNDTDLAIYIGGYFRDAISGDMVQLI